MKHFILILFSIVLFSCEQEDMSSPTIQTGTIENVNSEPQIIKTRAANGANGNVVDILEQISDVPVNIINVGANKKYLCVENKGSLVKLHPMDDGSLRQRFLIKSGNPQRLCLLGGNKSYNPGEIYADGFIISKPAPPILLEAGKKQYLGLGSGPIPDRLITYIYFNKSENDPQKYYIQAIGSLNLQLQPYKLQPTASNPILLEFSTKVKYDATDLWQIVPIEQFDLQGVRYIMEGNDYINKVATQLKTYTYTNINGPTPITGNIRLSETLTTSSTFQHSQGLSFGTKLTTSTKVGIPVINADLTVGAEYTVNNTYSFQYNKTETKSVTNESNHTFTIPAYTNVIISVIKSDYIAQITYIAKVRERNTGKILYVKGKWNGVIGDDILLDPAYSTTENPSGQSFVISGAKMLNDWMME